MKRSMLCLIVCTVTMGVGTSAYGAETGQLYAGTSSVVLTPQHALVGAGSGGGVESWKLPHDVTEDLPSPSLADQGIFHDDIYARALVLDNGHTSVAIVSLDMILFGSAHVVAEAKARYGVDHVILSSTHAHSSVIPRMFCPDQEYREAPMNSVGWGWDYVQDDPGDTVDFPGLSEDPWYANTEEAIITAIGDAMNNKFAASIVSDRGSFSSDHLAHNRRRVNPDGSVTMMWENHSGVPTEPVDETIGFVRINDDTGAARAFMTHFSCHPVALMDANIFSRDYPGVTVDAIEAELGPQCQAMFLQGAAGDIDPYYVGGQPFSKAEEQGLSVAENVLAAMNASTKQSESIVSLEVREEMVTFGQRGTNAGETTDAQVTTVVIGDDLALVSMPGEPFVQHQLDLYAESPIENTFLLGVSYSGAGTPYCIYVPTEEAAQQGGYGAAVDQCSYVAGNAGAMMVDQAIASLADMGYLPPVPGDANGDGVVDLQDFGILKHYMGTSSGATLDMGDFNGDGSVTLADFVILKANFASSESIPEPATMTLLALGAVLPLLRRRRQ